MKKVLTVLIAASLMLFIAAIAMSNWSEDKDLYLGDNVWSAVDYDGWGGWSFSSIASDISGVEHTCTFKIYAPPQTNPPLRHIQQVVNPFPETAYFKWYDQTGWNLDDYDVEYDVDYDEGQSSNVVHFHAEWPYE